MKTWFITGASSGFGRVLAEAALERGDRVFGTVRTEVDRAALAALAPGGSARAALCDVRDEAQVRAAVAAAVEAFGAPNVVVNNAGYGLFGAVEEVSDVEVREQFAVNVFGAWNVVRAVLPALRAAGRGHIVQLSSIAGLAAGANGSAYSASKFALEGMSEALAFEVAPFGIAVTLVEPGQFRTAFAGRSARVAAGALAAYPLAAAGAGARMQALDGHQPGDPALFAVRVLALVDHPQPPLRLLLGDDALRRARTKLDWLRTEIDAWETWSLETWYVDTPDGAGLPVFTPPPAPTRG
jgi:NAD(P)-dependent dehydrogenase (short-subunit alcohol dehydrogenase family)